MFWSDNNVFSMKVSVFHEGSLECKTGTQIHLGAGGSNET